MDIAGADQGLVVPLGQKEALLQAFPCFAALTASELQELANATEDVHFNPGDRIVVQDDIVDSIYIIVSGQAEVQHTEKKGKKERQVPVALLSTGDGIGLIDTGFYSTSGKRTATVVAMASITAIKLDVKALYDFLKQYHLESSMYNNAEAMMRMRFVKQSLPFYRIPQERLNWLVQHIEEMDIKAGTEIFKQGDAGNTCYLIYSGQIGITRLDESGIEQQIALLKPYVLFGEATLITQEARNATARALTDTKLFSLKHEYLSELMEQEDTVARTVMALMVDRSRPLQNPIVTAHQRTTADGQTLTILKNQENNKYFKLTKEGFFIWEKLDGQHTLQDITLTLAEQFNIFSPGIVAGLISKLSRDDFISNVNVHQNKPSKNVLVRSILKLRKILEVRITFGDADQWVTRAYHRAIHYFFEPIGQVLLGILAFLGLFAFVFATNDILYIFSVHHADFFLILALIPFSMLAAVLHELGHAFAVKAYRYDVHYLGIGWYWLTPIAFTDTSDMWLANRRSRIMVNLAGVYVDVLVAGLAAIFIFIIPNQSIKGLLWLFALYTYISAIRMLSPLQEMDGYYILMDWLEKPQLRKSSVIWLLNIFPKSILHPNLFRKHWPEVIYWLACLMYLTIMALLTLAIQAFVFIVLGVTSSHYITIILLFAVLIFSSLTVIADIRNQEMGKF